MGVRVPARIQQRTADRLVKPTPDACWDWPMSVGSHGYGQIGFVENGKRTMVLIHRAMWEWANGPIPGDLTVDHLCKNRRCGNPAHLRLLPNEINARCQCDKTECPKGHAYAGGNLYVDPRGYRRCRACARARRAS